MIRTRHFTIRACASPLAFPRAGVIVPRHGHSAVDRNQLKRRLREVVRTEVLPTDLGLDLVIRASPRAYALPFGSVRAEVREALGRLTLLKPA